MYQRPAGLSHFIAPQMRPGEWGLRRRDRLGGSRRKEAVPAPFFTIAVAFLKGYFRGHVTFRGLNKKKEFILLQNVLFFLFSLCGLLRPFSWQWSQLRGSLSVFLSVLRVLWCHLSSRWWHCCGASSFSSSPWRLKEGSWRARVVLRSVPSCEQRLLFGFILFCKPEDSAFCLTAPQCCLYLAFIS